MSTKIAILTSNPYFQIFRSFLLRILPTSLTPKDDDIILIESLKRLGIEAELVKWDNPNNWSRYGTCIIRSTWDYHLNETNASDCSLA